MMPLNMQPIEKMVGDSSDSHCVKQGLVLDVVGVWKTIQGEGPYAGERAVFVRLAGCNLQCPMCFGVSTKSRIPYLSRSTGSKVRLDRVQLGEKLLTFNEDLQLVETKVVAVHDRIVNDWLTLLIAGKRYDVTPEHPFFTSRGLVAAKDLVIDDNVLEARPNEIIAFKKLGSRNPMKRAEVIEKKVAHTNWKAMATKLSQTRLEQFKTGQLVPSFNTLTPERQNIVRKKQSEAKRREKNPNWSGKYPNWLDMQEAIKNGNITHCERCSEKKSRLLVHHHDGNHSNDSRVNLKVWCFLCHNRHHERGYNFWNGKRKDGKQLIKKHNGQTVEMIQQIKGSLKVKNISCEPYNTYLANGMWVHNCDTDYTTNRQIIGIDTLMDKVQSLMQSGLVVITGGEPLRQPIGPLITLLRKAGYKVQIETNGTLFRPELPYLTFHIVCSPKTAKISEQLEPYIHTFKYVASADDINTEDGLPNHALGMSCGVARPTLSQANIYLQPLDEQDPEKNKRNTQAVVDSCMKHGYRLCLQLHKIVGLD